LGAIHSEREIPSLAFAERDILMPRSVPEAVPVNLLSTYSNPYLESDLFKLMASRESAFGPTYI